MITLLTACQSSPSFKRIDDHEGDIYFWPKTFSDGNGRVLTLYQPQITDWKKFSQLRAIAAIAYKTPLDVKPTFGTMSLYARTSVHVDTRQVNATKIKVHSLKFPRLNSEKVKEIKELMKEVFPADGMVLSLDRLVANFKRKLTVKSAPVKSDPPSIYFSKDPAILVMFNGKPIWNPIKNTTLKFAMNTNWDLFLDTSDQTYYLRNFDGWMKASKLTGPWQAGPELPTAFNGLPDDDNWREVKANIPGRKLSPEASPNVYVSYKPSEMILLNGEPDLRPMENTSLMWVSNTDSDLFFSATDRFYYYLVSGRWFRCRELKNNARWEFASHQLPEDFKNISDNHPRARVKASVPGTLEAEAAVILAQIPQKAEVRKGKLKPVVNYAGEPKFSAIAGTQLSYAVNTSSDVIQYKNIYFLCQSGVWFGAKSPLGPWRLATKLPDDFSKIPPESPKYHTTYVNIYDTGPDSVIYGYTSGYSNVYVSYGVVVYGSGWYYPPYWYYPYYYYYPYSYGGSSFYNPHTGTYGNAGWAYGPYGGVGYATAYNPATGTYARGAKAYGPYGARRWVQAYNPQTNTRLRSVQGTDYYSSWGATGIRRDDQWVATAHYKNDQGSIRKFAGSGGHSGFIGYNENNLYAGKDGNVYRRNADGWQKYDNGEWSPIEKPGAGISSQRADRINQQRFEGGSLDKSRRLNDGVNQPSRSISQQLNRDHLDRKHGQRQLNQFRAWENQRQINRGQFNRGGGHRGSRMGRGRR